MKKAVVGVVVGSSSDLPLIKNTLDILKDFKVPYDVVVLSAHRSPKKTAEYARSARAEGIKVIIAAAGGAAHLAGTIASNTTLPVIGIPVPTKHLDGLDSLLSTIQMPSGVPVATVAIGEAGARNAAVLAVQILALSDGKLAKKLNSFKAALVKKVEQANRELHKHRNK